MVCRPSVAYLSVFKKTKFYQNTAMLTYLQSVDAFIHGRVEQLQQRLYIRPTKPKTFAIWHFKEKNYLTFTVCHTQELNKIYTESLWNHWVFQISSLRTYTPLKRLLQRQRILLLNKRTIVLSYFKCSPNNPAYLVCYSFLQFAAAAAKLLQSCPTLRPHRRQSTRLCRPWDSPGKNTGAGPFRLNALKKSCVDFYFPQRDVPFSMFFMILNVINFTTFAYSNITSSDK